MLTTQSISPDHKVTVQHRTISDAEGSKKASFETFDISDDVKAIRTNKTLGKAGGGFTIDLPYVPRLDGVTYDKFFLPNDVVLIELKRNSSDEFTPVMIGLIDRCTRSKLIDDGGKPKYSVKLHGTDFGKMFFKHDCGWDIQRLDMVDGSELEFREHKASQRGTWFQYSSTAKENIANIMQNLFFPQLGDWVKKFVDDTFKHVVTDSDWRTYSRTIHEQTGQIWNALKQFSDEPFNILYTDIDPKDGKFHIHLKKLPFNNDTGKLEGITFHIIRPKDIISEDLGVSDNELVNYVSVENYAPLYGGDDIALMFAKDLRYDADLVGQFGFRPFRPNSSYIPALDEKYQSTTDKENLHKNKVKERIDAFFNWHKNVHTYESGSMTVIGSPDIRIGEAIISLDNDYEYFIETVGHVYVFGEESTLFKTTLEITRGQPI